MAWTFRAVIEGFYGPPWSWAARADVMRWCHERGMSHFLYAPKDDPLHRERWRDLYPPEDVRAFEHLVAEDTLRLGFAISPGLSIDYRSPDDRAALAAKVDQMLAIGIDLICLAVDDIPPRPGLGSDHASLTTWLVDHLDDRATLQLVPTEYTGTASSAYLDELAAGVPRSVAIGWTGQTVVCDHITVEQAAARAAALDGRPPLIWDNYPVNDTIMADRLFLGPLRGRDAGLGSVCAGYASNPMVQPMASKPALASIAAYLRDEDPEGGWSDAVDLLDVRVLAEACDGEHPSRLVAVLEHARAGGLEVEATAALDELNEWLREARHLPDGAFAGEADAWTSQVRDEAGVGRVATRLLRALDQDDQRGAVEQSMALSVLWPAVRRGSTSVMGPRCSFRPVIDQWPDGGWRYHAPSLIEDANAIDRLVRLALSELARSSA